MTITPTSASPAPAGGVTGAPAAGYSDSGFADLVRQHLESGSDGSSQESAGGLLTTEQASALLEAASAPSAVPSEGLAALLAGLLAGSTVPRADSSTADAGGAAAAVADTDATVSAGIVATLPASGGTAPGAVLPDVTPATLGAASPMIGSPAVPVAGVPGATGQGVNVSTGPAAKTAQAAQPAETQPTVQAMQTNQSEQVSPSVQTAALLDTAGAAEQTATGPVAGNDSGGDAGAAPRADFGVPTPGSSPAPGAVSASAGTAGVSGQVAEGPVSHPVTEQVFGQVTRLVSRGDGTHRLTLRLHPADLGEVKVVLTVRDGAVDVSLSAGHAAREALRDGSPQLRALLELTGATTANVVVRDAAGNAATTVVGGQQATGQQPSGAGTGDAHDQGTDPDLASRDGLADGATDGSPNGNGDADTGAAPTRDLSGPGALAGVRVRPGEATAPPGVTEPASTGIPARLDLNL